MLFFVSSISLQAPTASPFQWHIALLQTYKKPRHHKSDECGKPAWIRYICFHSDDQRRNCHYPGIGNAFASIRMASDSFTANTEELWCHILSINNLSPSYRKSTVAAARSLYGHLTAQIIRVRDLVSIFFFARVEIARLRMSSQEQRSNISPLLVGEPPASSPFMNGPASSSPMVGTLKGACSKNQHGYSVAYGPDRFQLPEVDPTNPSSTPSSSSTPSGCAHHHNHSHHHLHHHHSHRDTAEHTNGPDAFSPQHYHHHYQQIGNDVAHSEEAERTLQKNQRNRMPPASGGGHEYQQLTLQAPQSRRAISSDDSQPNSVEVYQPQQNVHDTTNSDSDYLSSNLNLGANGRGCCQHKCRCENAANARRDVEDGNRPGGSQDPTARTRRK